MLARARVCVCVCVASVREARAAGDQAVAAVSATTQLLQHHNELRAPSAHRAAYYLDAAIAARTVPGRLCSSF